MFPDNCKVLVVDDDMDLQFLYRHKLEQAGVTVFSAGNGEIGLELAEKEKPDLILLDLMMPVMSGDVMLTKLRETDWGSGIRVVILTNLSKDEAPQILRFLHVDRYIVKAHHTPAQVVEIVSEILDPKHR